MYVKIAIVGRPNVGKSTLFNKIARKNSSIVLDMPGVTRDRIEAVSTLYGMKIKLIDTAGFDNTKQNIISQEMIKQSIKAIEDAEIILFMVDGREGLTQLDYNFAQILRKFNKEVILVCNKAENKPQDDILSDIYQLGFQRNVFISAEHKRGLEDLASNIKDAYQNKYGINLRDVGKLEEESEKYMEKNQRLSIAIVGRPNAGKSTLFNKLLNEYRSIVSEVAGTTRDSIHQEIKYIKENQNGEKIEYAIDLVDTAGIRKRLNIDDKIEEFSVESAFYSIKFSTVTILCMDAQNAFDVQDLRIADFSIQEGRGVILVLNKWDLLSENQRKEKIETLETFIAKTLPKVKGVPFFTISAKLDENLDDIVQECISMNAIWSKRINTAKLNGFLREISQNNPPARYKGHEVKVKYATQVGTRPMNICIFTNIKEGMSAQYQNFLENSIRNKFKIFGVPIRMNIKKSDNPFAHIAAPQSRQGQVTRRFSQVVKKTQKRK